eukprot:7356170-Alexandrium_andersonii.AAC.1
MEIWDRLARPTVLQHTPRRPDLTHPVHVSLMQGRAQNLLIDPSGIRGIADEVWGAHWHG